MASGGLLSSPFPLLTLICSPPVQMSTECLLATVGELGEVNGCKAWYEGRVGRMGLTTSVVVFSIELVGWMKWKTESFEKADGPRQRVI